MKPLIFALALSLSLSNFNARANPKDDEFEKIAKDYTENYLSSHPEFATELGDHRFDGVLSDYSPETRARMLATAKQVRELPSHKHLVESVAWSPNGKLLASGSTDGMVSLWVVETGKKGTKRPSQTRFGWDDGSIVSLEIPEVDPLEIDILAAAAPVLVGWSGGEDVSRLTGPIPPPETI